jgi:MFS family permease
MSVLTVNLKHLYQRRGLWLFYVIVILFALAGIAVLFDDTKAGQGRFIGLIVLAFVVGLLLAVLPIEVMSRPFSYCLPGHRKMVRKFVFCVGIVFNIFGSLLFFVYPSLNMGQLVLVVCSAFFAGLISYLFGAGLAFAVRNSVAFIGFLPLIIIAGRFFDLHTVLERVIVENPLVVISVGVLSSCVVWFWLGDEGRARKYCAVPWIGFFDALNPAKMKKISRIRMAGKWDKLKKYTSPRLERFFLGRMDRYDYVSAGRYIWGALYAAAVVPVLQWKSILSIVVLMSFFLGYCRDEYAAAGALEYDDFRGPKRKICRNSNSGRCSSSSS